MNFVFEPGLLFCFGQLLLSLWHVRVFFFSSFILIHCLINPLPCVILSNGCSQFGCPFQGLLHLLRHRHDITNQDPNNRNGYDKIQCCMHTEENCRSEKSRLQDGIFSQTGIFVGYVFFKKTWFLGKWSFTFRNGRHSRSFTLHSRYVIFLICWESMPPHSPSWVLLAGIQLYTLGHWQESQLFSTAQLGGTAVIGCND